MSQKPLSDEQLQEAYEAFKTHKSKVLAAEALDLHPNTFTHRFRAAERRFGKLELSKEELTFKQTGDETGEVIYVGNLLTDKDALLEAAGVDTEVWEVDRIIVNGWEVTGKKKDGHHHEKVWKSVNKQIKVFLKKKPFAIQSFNALLEEIRSLRPLKIKRKKSKPRKSRQALEICIMDPHIGVKYGDWSIDKAEDFYLWCVEDLIREAEKAYTLEKIFWVFGNDFNHCEAPSGRTTKGTPLEDVEDPRRQLYRGKQLALNVAGLMLEKYPVEAFQIPGNHDEHTSYIQGLLLDAYFHANDNFQIDCTDAPYKHIHYGQNLIGLEHGHNISPIRMAALMANEWRDLWAITEYHEWHCGDQHRKGVGKPVLFEEQGVSIEFCPGLVSPDRWHRKKSFNYQKRAATAFVLDYDCGIRNRITTNISKYTGEIRQ